ncbi:hypothetical protein L798_13125 [Zootermopsis nevadensis]|uniref:Uncharacterized protein n=1 Tax=Zootermopsis nevadensis TaxID=136037 RepID=A0A067QV26_ZOONE|nr:hypothetical protein L798_13125 [Zootermopsis nevadensis]
MRSDGERCPVTVGGRGGGALPSGPSPRLETAMDDDEMEGTYSLNWEVRMATRRRAL